MLEASAREHNETLNGEAKALVEVGLTAVTHRGSNEVALFRAMLRMLPQLRELVAIADTTTPQKQVRANTAVQCEPCKRVTPTVVRRLRSYLPTKWQPYTEVILCCISRNLRSKKDIVCALKKAGVLAPSTNEIDVTFFDSVYAAMCAEERERINSE